MGYDLSARNKDAGSFHFGAFSFPVLLDACGYLWPCIGNGAQWYCVWGVDPRMPDGDNYPRIRSNDGFAVTAEEAKIMARVARNFVAIQRSLPDNNKADDAMTRGSVNQEQLLNLMTRALQHTEPGPWPVKIREDFVDRFEAFAEWADTSGGFKIW